MMKAPSPLVISRLEKVATDNGFDQALGKEGAWLVFVSTQSSLRVWLGAFDETIFAAFSQQNVVLALGEHGEPMTAPIPTGAAGGHAVSDIPRLHRLLRRALQLSKSLPNELLHTFEKQVANLPRTTEAERLVVQRVGQNVFRDGLLEYWEGRCAITGLAIPELLRASHIKPWAACASDAERLDIFNGLLLAPHLDALFDKGWITVTDGGSIEVSPSLLAQDRVTLGVDRPLRVHQLSDGHRHYLAHHRTTVFARS
jgi:putative restriction endonuclease